MWVELPEGTDVDALFEAAAERGVQFVKGTDFLLEGGENTLRLAYSGVTPDADRRGRRAPRRGVPLAAVGSRRPELSGRSGLRAEHELLGQRDARRRRRVGDDRDRLGDAAASARRGAPPASDDDLVVAALGERALHARARCRSP